LADSDSGRLSVALVDVARGRENDFHAFAREFAAILLARGYGRAEIIRDEAQPLRFYFVCHWADAGAAETCHADTDAQALTATLFQIARVTHVVNGARRPAKNRLLLDDRRERVEADRRTGFDRRLKSDSPPDGEPGQATSIWSPRRGGRASMPTPRSRISGLAPRWKRRMAPSSPAAISRTPRTG
jgi:quinol monooxygenase YgiN